MVINLMELGCTNGNISVPKSVFRIFECINHFAWGCGAQAFVFGMAPKTSNASIVKSGMFI